MECNRNSRRAEVYHVCKCPDTQTYANGPLISRKEIQGHVYLTTDLVKTP